MDISTDALLKIALGAGLLAFLPLCGLVLVYSVQELIRRIRHWDTKAPPQPLIRAKFFGQEVEFAQVSQEIVDAMAKQRAELERVEHQLVKFSVRVLQLEEQSKESTP